MSQSLVAIKAGEEAYSRINTEGLTSDMISGVASAAGGPKWFTVYGLVRYILADFLKDAQHPLHFIGASVGSWQMTSALTSDPGEALDRLCERYAGYVYDEDPGPNSIADACSDIISSMLDDETEFILNHPTRQLHVITSRGKGWLAHDNKVAKGLGFGYSFLLNAINRKNLDVTAVRTILSNSCTLPFDTTKDVLKTLHAKLSRDNLLPALLGSGSIPFISPGVKNISGVPAGTYWDGGLTDYHISLPYNTDGLILHPHFFPHVYAGWFDKKLPWDRTAIAPNMSKAVLIHPTQAFVDSLPKQRISEMQDFYEFGEDQEGRSKYWRTIAERSKEMGAELHELITSGKVAEVMTRY